jgi:hypothetical protein
VVQGAGTCVCHATPVSSCTGTDTCNATTGACDKCVPNGCKVGTVAADCGDDGCGGKCGNGVCPDGKFCNPISGPGLCSDKAPCDPACATDEWCDQSQADPVCIKICNAPMGCKATEICVPDGTGHAGTCQAVKCSGVQCEQGQICDDGSNTGFQGCTCLPEYTDKAGTVHADTCADFGLICDMDTSSESTIALSKCRMPRAWEECSPAIGCEKPDTGAIDCVSGVFDVPVCMRACSGAGAKADSKLCTDLLTVCYGGQVKNHCYYNICADPNCTDPNTPACVKATERTKLFGPCSSISANDSTCLPFNYSNGDPVGICFQGGTATNACDPDAVRSGTPPYTTLCAPSGAGKHGGAMCVDVMPDPADPKLPHKGLCMTLCNAQTGASAAPTVDCADSATACIDESGAPDTETITRLGMCMTKCNLFGTDVCPDDFYANKQGCGPAGDFAGAGYCSALRPNAAPFGAECTVDNKDPDRRSNCADRTTCLQYTADPVGHCYGLCQSSVSGCTDASKTCFECVADSCCTPACTAKKCDDDDGCGGKCGGCTGSTPRCDTGTHTCVAACTPVCTAKKCDDDDGCGAKCGGCTPLTQKCDTGTHACVTCTPACTGKDCGPDGCGGICGTTGCVAGTTTCDDTGKCVACKADCTSKNCGDDHCGGTCGTCAGSKVCFVQDLGLACTPVFQDAQGQAVITPVQICGTPQ